MSPQQQRRALHLLSAMVACWARFVLRQLHAFVGWCVLALLLAVVLNPAVDRLQRHRVPRTLSTLEGKQLTSLYPRT